MSIGRDSGGKKMDRSKVLVLDHDPGFLSTLSGALSRGGTLPLEVSVSQSGARAVPEAPDCDALVCTVDRKEEIDFLARLKKADGRLPVVVLIPSRNVALALHARESGVESILPRDRDLATLGGLVRAAVENVILSNRSSSLAGELRVASREVRDLVGETRRIVRTLRARAPMRSEAHPILAVDDDADLAPLLQDSFARSGFACPHIARSVEEAIAFLAGTPPFEDRQRFPLPYMVFLQLQLPTTPGVELLKWMRTRPEFSQTVVIANLAASVPEDVRRAYDAGANSVVARPSTAEDWRELVAALRTFWGRMNV